MAINFLKRTGIGRWFKWLKWRRNTKQVYAESNVPENIQNDSQESYSEGRFGIFHGQLPNGKQIAVKRFSKHKFRSGIDFSSEAAKLGQLRHKNILRIQGYCSERDEKMIVYDYMPNLCLLAHINGALSYGSHMDWKTRIAIAQGSAEGLVYLHYHANPGIVHGNLKASNIILDANYEPLLSDYGLANLMNEPSAPEQLSGYEAPEGLRAAAEGRHITKKNDVFSFGIILLVLVTGRRPYDKSELLEQEYIVNWAERVILEGKEELLVDQNVGSNYDKRELELLLHTAISCAQANPENRPTMLQVVEQLNRISLQTIS